MKKGILLGLGLIMAFFTTSCTFSETIVINENGSGKVSFDIDGSGLMAMAGDKMAEDGEKRIDSSFTFKELLAEKADSISKLPKEEQARLKSLERFTVKMLVDPASKEMTINMFADFDKADNLQDMMNLFGNMSNMNKKAGQPDMGGLFQNGSEVTYKYDGKKFVRGVKMVDKPKKKDEEGDEEMYKAMFGESNYQLNYTFPKKVKKVSNKNAVISADKKTVTLTYPLSEFFDNPKAMALDVEFEK
ncbi:hypothetical protein [uncultured Flavobacterium sp.]|uniref:hypothetical protein n=1 Tax=uncultured Flavobacterium sp. TaxID=165435 RepID=UPI0025D8AD96|nr:hypothetical protein [uncultured Flavobacterium sp.]